MAGHRIVIGCKADFRRRARWGILLIRQTIVVAGVALLLGTEPCLAADAASVQVRIQQAPLAGFQFHAGQALWDKLAEGDALALTREPDNRHDPRAVRVDWRGVALGYLPRGDNAVVAEAMDQGWRVTARIGRLAPHPDPWRRVRVDVFAAPPCLPARRGTEKRPC